VTTVTVQSDREVDALVAEHIFGWRWITCIATAGGFSRGRTYLLVDDTSAALLDQHSDKFIDDDGSGVRRAHHTPNYTTDPVACARLKRKLREAGWAIELFIPSNRDRDDAWFCSVERMTTEDEVGGNGIGTEERALALAALRAYGIEVEYVPAEAVAT